ncbi:hypothetical protein CYY_006574 [Polysphondylium violaceum]|uniref:Uncharacterized protein n=1 Tax=Polysphondylium violaceum TaxID=133409 RepID=A0A8J4PQ37_9MYCE|nr:hypothetical protein CYY_006574 [Polysphondylium violaceum]
MKFIITLFVLLSVAISYTRADTYSVGIWNNGTNINVGLIDLTNGMEAQLKLVIPGAVFPSNSIQPSTYNYATKFLSFYGLQSKTSPYLYVVDCNSWTLVSKSSYSYLNIYSGLASTGTTANNLFTTYSAGGVLSVARIDPSSKIVYKFDSFYGNYRGSVYVPSISSYYVAYTNQTGLYIRAYNSNYQLAFTGQFGFANNPYPINDYPLNLVYSPLNQAVMAQVYMTDSNNRPYYALAYLDWNAGLFHVTNMDGYTGDQFLSTLPDTLGQQLAYSFAYSFGQYVIYTFNTASNVFLTYRPYLTPVLSAF